MWIMVPLVDPFDVHRVVFEGLYTFLEFRVEEVDEW